MQATKGNPSIHVGHVGPMIMTFSRYLLVPSAFQAVSIEMTVSRNSVVGLWVS